MRAQVAIICRMPHPITDCSLASDQKNDDIENSNKISQTKTEKVQQL
jgi:hypothetical protein